MVGPMTFKEGQPIYVQIAERLCDEVLAGVYGAGERIPSVREYSVLLEVNVNTTVKAYDYLAQRGVIYNRRGMGYYVADEAAGLIRDRRRHTFLEEELPELFRRMALLGIGLDEISALYQKWSAGRPGSPPESR